MGKRRLFPDSQQHFWSLFTCPTSNNSRKIRQEPVPRAAAAKRAENCDVLRAKRNFLRFVRLSFASWRRRDFWQVKNRKFDTTWKFGLFELKRFPEYFWIEYLNNEYLHVLIYIDNAGNQTSRLQYFWIGLQYIILLLVYCHTDILQYTLTSVLAYWHITVCSY